MTDAAAVAEDFNPRSPHGERPRLHRRECRLLLISIHAPRTGSDATYFAMQIASDVFQSTLPARGATPPDTIIIAQGIYISIHAPRTGSDALALSSTLGEDRFQSTLPARGATSTLTSSRWRRKNFNPRSPHGERRTQTATSERGKRFQSTLPARGATLHVHCQAVLPSISIHAPRTGSDGCRHRRKRQDIDFNPRSPHGERHSPPWLSPGKVNFNPRSPHGERPSTVITLRPAHYFNPRSPHGERR